MEVSLMQQRFANYANNIKDNWLDRFTWKGLYGDTPKNSISIVNFAKQTNAFENIEDFYNANDFHRIVVKLSKLYIKWIQAKDNSYSDEELINLKNFFLGAIGEYFFMILLDTLKRFIITGKDGKLQLFDFNYIAPRLKNELDYGVDLTGVISHGMSTSKCAIQVKFWDPNIDTPITNKIAQSIHSDAICNNFIDNNENDNIVICWLGDTKNVSKYLYANKALYKHIVFIDNKVLDDSINNQNIIFWQHLKNNLADIKNFK